MNHCAGFLLTFLSVDIGLSLVCPSRGLSIPVLKWNSFKHQRDRHCLIPLPGTFSLSSSQPSFPQKAPGHPYLSPWPPPLTSLAALKCNRHSPTCRGTACCTTDVASVRATVLKCWHIWLPLVLGVPSGLCPLLIPSESQSYHVWENPPDLGVGSAILNAPSTSATESFIHSHAMMEQTLVLHSKFDTLSGHPPTRTQKVLDPLECPIRCFSISELTVSKPDALLNKWCLQTFTESNLSITVAL